MLRIGYVAVAASIAVLAALGLIALLPGAAAAQLPLGVGGSGDTFTGSCSQAPGTVSWATPLTFGLAARS